MKKPKGLFASSAPLRGEVKQSSEQTAAKAVSRAEHHLLLANCVGC
jgi:hypothetical protein